MDEVKQKQGAESSFYNMAVIHMNAFRNSFGDNARKHAARTRVRSPRNVAAAESFFTRGVGMLSRETRTNSVRKYASPQALRAYLKKSNWPRYSAPQSFRTKGREKKGPE